jgi:hypothetical protein
MPKNQDSLNSELGRFLRRFRPTMRDSTGKVVPVPEQAEVFQFKFIVDGEDYGTVTVSVDGMHKLVIYFNDGLFDSPKVSDQGDITWEQAIRMIKDFAKSKQLSFELKNEDELETDMAKRDHVKKLDEGYYPMGRKQSYSDAIPECKIIIKHSKFMEEGEQRFRNVERIFIENSQGERFLAPTTRPGIARVYARHIAEGGQPFDDRWKHIGAIVEDYTKMAGFVRATKGGQFNESAQKLVNEGVQHYLGLRESLHALTTRRGYGNYFESWTPPLMEDEMQEDLSDMFKTSQLDPRIESVMPILSKLSKNITETKLDEVTSLEEWADSIIEGSLIPKTSGQIEQLDKIISKEKFALGPDGSFAKNALEPVLHDDDLFAELEQAGKEDPNGDAKEIIVSWMASQNNPEFQTVLDKLQNNVPSIDENKEADYGNDYQDMVSRVGKKAKEQEKKKPVDIADLARRLHAVAAKDKKSEQLDEILPALAAAGGEIVGGAIAGELGAGAMGTAAARAVGGAVGQSLATDDTNEGLDKQQKAAGQLGPTEKVKNNNIGKLVGTSESVDPLLRIKNLSGLQK